jgi:hypothetical protein
MMQPTVGRVVHYRNQSKSDQPCCALIVYVWNEDLVNLVSFDMFGNPEPHTSVYRGLKDYQWEWMPYQKQKAAAGDHNSESAEPRPGPEPNALELGKAARAQGPEATY